MCSTLNIICEKFFTLPLIDVINISKTLNILALGFYFFIKLESYHNYFLGINFKLKLNSIILRALFCLNQGDLSSALEQSHKLNIISKFTTHIIFYFIRLIHFINFLCLSRNSRSQ